MTRRQVLSLSSLEVHTGVKVYKVYGRFHNNVTFIPLTAPYN